VQPRAPIPLDKQIGRLRAAPKPEHHRDTENTEEPTETIKILKNIAGLRNPCDAVARSNTFLIATHSPLNEEESQSVAPRCCDLEVAPT